jgi:hypothetical protein
MFKPVNVFFAVFILYFGIHTIYGYTVCIRSEWILCPGQTMDHNQDNEDDE